MACDSYFTILAEVYRNYVSSENIYFTKRIEWVEHTIIVWKISNKYQIVQQCHNFKNISIDDHSLFTEQKFCKHHVFTESKITNWRRGNINHSNIYLLLIYSGARKALRWCKIIFDAKWFKKLFVRIQMCFSFKFNFIIVIPR